ncbi:MAG TPA: dATP/dGTP diphosphohydrolase domain-containing protein, partial [Candidatus Paceibacterota bacterium]|nr:dATP/dGTP diphosphohydrolase domain-containing protein [Candidatus Paceibacterota bacterium]
MEFKEVKDSGKRQDFDTGSRRDTRDGKGRYDLLPVRAIKRLAKHYENGAKKYGDRNWEKGQPLSRYLDSALRH